MYRKLITNDIRRSKLITATITAFILIAAMLTSVSASLVVNLFGAINGMMAEARVLDFMQMHTGDVDMAELERFAGETPAVDEYQALPFLNIEGAEIILGEASLADSVQDNGLTVQSGSFDFLIGLNGEILNPADGEIYLPIYYRSHVEIGGTVTICGLPFTLAGYHRDSTMNAALAGSKRLLVSEADFERLREHGKLENLIEFRLTEGASLPEFEAAYLAADMPANGPPVITRPLVGLMNGMTDGMMIAVMLLIVILVVVVAFLCIRLTLLAKIEEDYREIGVLKAVGMRVSEIKRLYLAKYGALAGIACALGFLASIPLREPFLTNIRLYMGDGGSGPLALLVGFVGAAAIYGVVLLYVNGVLRRFRKISAAQAVRFGAPEEKSRSARGFRLSGNRLFSQNIFLGLKDVLSRGKLYLTMLLVLVISSFIMIVPQNIHNTISSEGFITNMGMGLSDAHIEIMSTGVEDVRQSAADVAAQLDADGNIARYAVFYNMIFDRIADDGTRERMRVNLGDWSAFPITYAAGRAPVTEDEIAISTLYAGDLDKGPGDEITLLVDGGEKRLTVCGTYSDVTNAGRTAQALFGTKSGVALMAGVPLTFHDRDSVGEAVRAYRERFPFAKVVSSDEMLGQTLGTMRASVRVASYAAAGVALLLTALVTVLFMKMLVAKDRCPIAILKSMGFTGRDIRAQYLARSVAVLTLGVVIGTVLANTLGELVGIAMVSAFGASSFDFAVNPWFAYLLSPLLIGGCVWAATVFGVADVRSLKISAHIKEA